jgi:hypothetical protein
MTRKHEIFPWSDQQLHESVTAAVSAYWSARGGQSRRQKDAGITDAGTRGEVTGGQHLDAFCHLICDIIRSAGFLNEEIRFRTGVELPGYYRPTKKWDIVVVRGDRLCAAIEMKSQVGPSFGNNFNNRTEEAIGSSIDFWVAFREGAMGAHQPWLGYFFFLEKAPGSTSPVGLAKGVFEPMPIFHGTSYADRYAILCRRLVFERNYSAASLILSPRGEGGAYSEPDEGLSFNVWAKALFGHLIGCT